METPRPPPFKFCATLSTSSGLVPATKRLETRCPREEPSANCRSHGLSESVIRRAPNSGLRQADVSVVRAGRAGAQEVVPQMETKGLRNQAEVSVWLPHYGLNLISS